MSMSPVETCYLVKLWPLTTAAAETEKWLSTHWFVSQSGDSPSHMPAIPCVQWSSFNYAETLWRQSKEGTLTWGGYDQDRTFRLDLDNQLSQPDGIRPLDELASFSFKDVRMEIWSAIPVLFNGWLAPPALTGFTQFLTCRCIDMSFSGGDRAFITWRNNLQHDGDFFVNPRPLAGTNRSIDMDQEGALITRDDDSAMRPGTDSDFFFQVGFEYKVTGTSNDASVKTPLVQIGLKPDDKVRVRVLQASSSFTAWNTHTVALVTTVNSNLYDVSVRYVAADDKAYVYINGDAATKMTITVTGGIDTGVSSTATTLKRDTNGSQLAFFYARWRDEDVPENELYKYVKRGAGDLGDDSSWVMNLEMQDGALSLIGANQSMPSVQDLGSTREDGLNTGFNDRDAAWYSNYTGEPGQRGWRPPVCLGQPMHVPAWVLDEVFGIWGLFDPGLNGRLLGALLGDGERLRVDHHRLSPDGATGGSPPTERSWVFDQSHDTISYNDGPSDEDMQPDWVPLQPITGSGYDGSNTNPTALTPDRPYTDPFRAPYGSNDFRIKISTDITLSVTDTVLFESDSPYDYSQSVRTSILGPNQAPNSGLIYVVADSASSLTDKKVTALLRNGAWPANGVRVSQQTFGLVLPYLQYYGAEKLPTLENAELTNWGLGSDIRIGWYSKGDISFREFVDDMLSGIGIAFIADADGTHRAKGIDRPQSGGDTLYDWQSLAVVAIVLKNRVPYTKVGYLRNNAVLDQSDISENAHEDPRLARALTREWHLTGVLRKTAVPAGFVPTPFLAFGAARAVQVVWDAVQRNGKLQHIVLRGPVRPGEVPVVGDERSVVFGDHSDMKTGQDSVIMGREWRGDNVMLTVYTEPVVVTILA